MQILRCAQDDVLLDLAVMEVGGGVADLEKGEFSASRRIRFVGWDSIYPTLAAMKLRQGWGTRGLVAG